MCTVCNAPHHTTLQACGTHVLAELTPSFLSFIFICLRWWNSFSSAIGLLLLFVHCSFEFLYFRFSLSFTFIIISDCMIKCVCVCVFLFNSVEIGLFVWFPPPPIQYVSLFNQFGVCFQTKKNENFSICLNRFQNNSFDLLFFHFLLFCDMTRDAKFVLT